MMHCTVRVDVPCDSPGSEVVHTLACDSPGSEVVHTLACDSPCFCSASDLHVPSVSHINVML